MKKKAIAIIIAAVILIGVAFFIGKSKVDEYNRNTNRVIDVILQTDGNYHSDFEDMIEGEGYNGEHYLKIKDTEKFSAKLQERIKLLIEENPNSYDYVMEHLQLALDMDILSEETIELIDSFEKATAQSYADEIAKSLEGGDYRQVAELLSHLITKNLYSEELVDITEITKELLENCDVYSLENGTGAYYDMVALKNSHSSSDLGVEWMDPIGVHTSIHTEKALGDFCSVTAYSSDYYEALEGFDFEHKYNTSSTDYGLLLRGKDINGRFWPTSVEWAAKDGAKFLICSKGVDKGNKIDTDGILMLSEDRIYVVDYYGDNPSTNTSVHIDGSFADIMDSAKKLYSEKFAVSLELDNAMTYMDNKEYEKALDILCHYSHLNGTIENIYTIAVDCLREGKNELGLKALEYIPYFEPIKGLDMDYMLNNLEGSFQSDVKYSEDYPQVFLRLMMDVNPALTDSEITKAFEGAYCDMIPDGVFNFSGGGTGAYKRGGGSFIDFEWTVKDNTLSIKNESQKDPIVYKVNKIKEKTYLLSYTTDYSSKVFMTLLRVK